MTQWNVEENHCHRAWSTRSAARSLQTERNGMKTANTAQPFCIGLNRIWLNIHRCKIVIFQIYLTHWHATHIDVSFYMRFILCQMCVCVRVIFKNKKKRKKRIASARAVFDVVCLSISRFIKSNTITAHAHQLERNAALPFSSSLYW